MALKPNLKNKREDILCIVCSPFSYIINLLMNLFGSFGAHSTSVDALASCKDKYRFLGMTL